MNKIIKLNNIFYKQKDITILNDVSLSLNFGKTYIIKGDNGAGKTSLLKLMYGLIEPSSGNVNRIFNNTYKSTYLFQNSVFLNTTVSENLKNVLYCSDITKDKHNKMVDDLLTRYNLINLKDIAVKKLSGGEKQLLSILRTLIINPDIFFYDEPTNNLDKKNFCIIIDLFQKLLDENKQLIIISHDDELLQLFDYTEIFIESGKVINEKNII